MVRAPCCERMGMKKGPWTRDEDRILVTYINMFGHGNWRALPKLAGLSRCGKSCRLRWTNYLRPDIKRGNFTRDEEQTIIQLHAAMGNRWSAIAAQLPGRTDNEIKNVWHTHLKKGVSHHKSQCCASGSRQRSEELKEECVDSLSISSLSKPSETSTGVRDQTTSRTMQLNSPYSEDTSVITMDRGTDMQVFGNFKEVDDEEFWSEILSGENPSEIMVVEGGGYKLNSSMRGDDDMQFWLNVFTRGDELLQT